MRISDWSSDVCSSDLIAADVGGADLEQIVEAARDHVAFLDLRQAAHRGVELAQRVLARVRQLDLSKGDMIETDLGRVDDRAESDDQSAFLHPFDALLARCLDRPTRSDEHTSELQSLIRISYAVLCLKKKTNKEL